MALEKETGNHEIILNGEHFLKVLPDETLRKYIANYGVFFLEKCDFSDKCILVPDGCGTISLAIENDTLTIELWGTRTKTVDVGPDLKKNQFLLLIDFLPGGLYKFTKHNQNVLANKRVLLKTIDSDLEEVLRNSIQGSINLDILFNNLNQIFLRTLEEKEEDTFERILTYILSRNGNVTISELTNYFHYSNSYLYRHCLKYLGVNLKLFLRIVRMNNTIHDFEITDDNLTAIAQNNEYYDQAHFGKEFKSICGITPSEYKKNMNDFYNQIIK